MNKLKRLVLVWLDGNDNSTHTLRPEFAAWCLAANETDFKVLVSLILNHRDKP